MPDSRNPVGGSPNFNDAMIDAGLAGYGTSNGLTGTSGGMNFGIDSIGVSPAQAAAAMAAAGWAGFDGPAPGSVSTPAAMDFGGVPSTASLGSGFSSTGHSMDIGTMPGGVPGNVTSGGWNGSAVSGSGSLQGRGSGMDFGYSDIGVTPGSFGGPALSNAGLMGGPTLANTGGFTGGLGIGSAAGPQPGSFGGSVGMPGMGRSGSGLGFDDSAGYGIGIPGTMGSVSAGPVPGGPNIVGGTGRGNTGSGATTGRGSTGGAWGSFDADRAGYGLGSLNEFAGTMGITPGMMAADPTLSMNTIEAFTASLGGYLGSNLSNFGYDPALGYSMDGVNLGFSGGGPDPGGGGSIGGGGSVGGGDYGGFSGGYDGRGA